VYMLRILSYLDYAGQVGNASLILHICLQYQVRQRFVIRLLIANASQGGVNRCWLMVCRYRYSICSVTPRATIGTKPSRGASF
jgi:hypothetical protein